MKPLHYKSCLYLARYVIILYNLTKSVPGPWVDCMVNALQKMNGPQWTACPTKRMHVKLYLFNLNSIVLVH